MPRLSAALATQMAASAQNTAPSKNYLANVDLYSSDPATSGATGALGSPQPAGTWSGTSTLAIGTAMSFTTNGTTAYGYFGTKASDGSYGIGGQLGAVVTAPTITGAVGAFTLAVA